MGPLVSIRFASKPYPLGSPATYEVTQDWWLSETYILQFICIVLQFWFDLLLSQMFHSLALQTKNL